MTYLLDVNVLIALMDESHVHHAKVFSWFEDEGRESWASCPITENGLLRIMSNIRYANWIGGPATILSLFIYLSRRGGHEFWSDDISFLDPQRFKIGGLRTHKALTDVYLLGLAKHRGGKFATLDRHIITDAVLDGASALHVIAAE